MPAQCGESHPRWPSPRPPAGGHGRPARPLSPGPGTRAIGAARARTVPASLAGTATGSTAGVRSPRAGAALSSAGDLWRLLGPRRHRRPFPQPGYALDVQEIRDDIDHPGLPELLRTRPGRHARERPSRCPGGPHIPRASSARTVRVTGSDAPASAVCRASRKISTRSAVPSEHAGTTSSKRPAASRSRRADRPQPPVATTVRHPTARRRRSSSGAPGTALDGTKPGEEFTRETRITS